MGLPVKMLGDTLEFGERTVEKDKEKEGKSSQKSLEKLAHQGSDGNSAYHLRSQSQSSPALAPYGVEQFLEISMEDQEKESKSQNYDTSLLNVRMKELGIKESAANDAGDIPELLKLIQIT